jgi:HlyD family secretion protein
VKKIGIPLGIVIIAAVSVVFYLARTGLDNKDNIVLSGTIEAVEVDLAFKTGGRVYYIRFEESDAVSQGDTISELTHREIEARINQADDQIAAARANLKSLKIEMDSATRNLRKVTNLIPSGGATLGQKEDLEDKVRGIDAAIEAAESAFRSAVSQRDYLQVAYENEFLISPIDGTVLLRSTEPYEVVGPGEVIVTLANLASLEITIYLPEIYLGRIRNGQDVRIVVDSHPNRKFEGRISRISDKAEFTPKNIQTVDERVKTVYGVTVSTGDHDGVLKPGMPCDVTVGLSP